MFQEEASESIKVLDWKEIQSAQDTEMRPMWLQSPTHPYDPTSPAFHPTINADATGAMDQHISFMLISASNNILPDSKSEAFVWLCLNFISHFT